ncbi:protein of unknown function [Clostridium beijerinckii]|nr:protein of unknown function [Clostridium beijerinckii]
MNLNKLNKIYILLLTKETTSRFLKTRDNLKYFINFFLTIFLFNYNTSV